MEQRVWIPRGQFPEKLTPRQEQVAIALSRGRTVSEVAVELGISRNSAATHVHNIYGRIDVHDRISLIKYVIERGAEQVRSSPPATFPRHAGAHEMSELTPRETRVAILRSRGLSARDVAMEMGISHKTVQVHLRNIYIFLNVHNVSSLTRYVMEKRLDK